MQYFIESDGKMRLKSLIILLALLSLLSIPATGELTEYQRGVANGLKVGLYMGGLYGRGQYSADYAREFNNFLDPYKQFLVASFGNNQTLINEFTLSINQSAVNEVRKSTSTTSQSQLNGDVF